MVEWRIRVRGKQRQPVDLALVVRAIIMMGKQLERERHADIGQEPEQSPTEGAAASSPEATS